MSRVAQNVEGERRVALVDLLDRVLAGGVVITGDIKLAIADVDLVQISLRALISSISTLSTLSVPLGPTDHRALETPRDD
ncbi:gas vesicle protein [Streptomyces gardneri]|uniref:gas vesicle protein n=1 Tax=Nocardia TaxID=1817 RepID=UPI0013583871|nr:MULTISPECIES: gas vesicle protein [Nocardia]MBF6163520.1 gas vesicle protein [Streptomyces gardneri]MBF6202508.1 gas vesicle protein [Streptomyces gardneri]UAK35072.1 gas vesicle protein [Nocardia asteroides]